MARHRYVTIPPRPPVANKPLVLGFAGIFYGHTYIGHTHTLFHEEQNGDFMPDDVRDCIQNGQLFSMDQNTTLGFRPGRRTIGPSNTPKRVLEGQIRRRGGQK